MFRVFCATGFFGTVSAYFKQFFADIHPQFSRIARCVCFVKHKREGWVKARSFKEGVAKGDATLPLHYRCCLCQIYNFRSFNVHCENYFFSDRQSFLAFVLSFIVLGNASDDNSITCAEFVLQVSELGFGCVLPNLTSPQHNTYQLPRSDDLDPFCCGEGQTTYRFAEAKMRHLTRTRKTWREVRTDRVTTIRI